MKTFLVLAILCAGLCSPVSFAQAPQDNSENAPSGPKNGQKMQKGNFQDISREQLVNLDASRSMTRIDDLERRVSALERDGRSLDDRIRMTERSVDDLRRSIR